MSKKVSIILALIIGGAAGTFVTLYMTAGQQKQPTVVSVSSELSSEISKDMHDKLSRRDEGIAHLAFLLRRQTKRYDALPILKEIYQGEIFSHVEGTIIHIYDENGKIMRTIEPPEPFKDGPFSFDTAKISPNKRFVLTTIGIGDGGHAWIYDIQNDSLHEVTEGFGLGELGWLADNRIVLHSGCVAAEYCKRLESVSSETPWVVEVVKDLGRYE